MSLAAGLAIAAMASQAAGGLIQAQAQRDQGALAARSGRINAAMLRRQAVFARARGREQAQAIEEEGARLQGSIRAAASASGIAIEGSPTEVMLDEAGRTARNRLRVLEAARREARTFEMQADLARLEGEMARDMSEVSAFGTLLGAAGQVTSTYFQTRGVFGSSGSATPGGGSSGGGGSYYGHPSQPGGRG